MKKGFPGFIAIISVVILVFGSCDSNFFEEGVIVKNYTNWDISACFSADKVNPTGEGWISISSYWSKNVPAKDGNWYLGIRTDGSNAPALAPEISWSASTIRTGRNISSIEVRFVDGVNADYSYNIIYSDNRSVVGIISPNN